MADVAVRLGVSQHSLACISGSRSGGSRLLSAKRRLRSQRRCGGCRPSSSKRVTEERDIQEGAAAYFAKQSG